MNKRGTKPKLEPMQTIAPFPVANISIADVSIAPQPQPLQPRIPRQRTHEEMLKVLQQIVDATPHMRHFRDDDNPSEVVEDMIAELLRGRELIESEKQNVMVRAAELGRRF